VGVGDDLALGIAGDIDLLEELERPTASAGLGGVAGAGHVAPRGVGLEGGELGGGQVAAPALC
jgi:hypothetical protein